MRTIPAGEFKAKCLGIMDEVNTSGETVIITKRGKPVARLVPFDSASETRRPIFGAMKDMFTITGDIVSSEYSDAEWEEFAEQDWLNFQPNKSEMK